MRAAEKLAQSFATIAHAQGRFLEELFSDSSDQKLFPTDNSTLDTTHSGEGNIVAEEQDGTAGTSTLEVWEVLMWFDSEVAVWVSGAAETVDYFR